MGIFSGIDTVNVDIGQRLFTDKIILVQPNQGKVGSNSHSKAIGTATVNGDSIIKYGVLVVPGASDRVDHVVGNHASVAIECKNVIGKLRGGIVLSLDKRSDFPPADRDDI